LRHAVGELGESIRADRIDAHFIKGGSLTFARNPVQEARLRHEVDGARERGLNETDLRWLDEHELYEYGYVAGALGATFTRTARASTRRVSLGTERRG